MKKSRMILFSIAMPLMFSLACSAVSNFIATPSAVPTFTPIPSATPEPPASEVLISDDFSSDSSGWGTGTDTESSVEYEDGTLHFQVFSDKYVTWSSPDREKYSNSHIDVAVENNGSDDLSLFGIICHEQDNEAFYYLGVASDGYYAIAKSEENADNVYYSDGNSDLIPKGKQSFTLSADCGAGNLVLYVNGQQIASVQDSTFTSGYVGLFAWSGDAANSTDVKFDDFTLTDLP